jgi:hypothetical protein
VAQPPGPSGWLATGLAGPVGGGVDDGWELLAGAELGRPELLGPAGVDRVLAVLPADPVSAVEAMLRLVIGAGRPVSDIGARLQPASAVATASTAATVGSSERAGRWAGRGTSGAGISVDPQVGAVRHLELPGGRAG